MFNAFDPDRTEISGPFNAVRMEGEIDGLKKVVYMFMDFHMPANNQTECANVYSQDFNRYLAETFHDLNGADRVYDFFFEIHPEVYKVDSAARAEAIEKQGRYGFRDKYIWQVINLLKSTVKYDASNDKVGISEVFQNVRLHYLDIRPALNQISYYLQSIPICSNLYCNDFPPIIFELLWRASNYTRSLVDLYQSIRKDRTFKPSPKEDSDHRLEASQLAFSKVIHKLLYGYKHDNVREVITTKADYYFGELEALVGMIDDFASKLEGYIKILTDQTTTYFRDNLIEPGVPVEERIRIFDDIQLNLANLHSQELYAGIGITDCYLLRRLLDKGYVTNAIIYTGGSHTINYISVLAKDFGFRVTNVSFTRASSISELNSTLTKRLAAGERITDLFIGDRLDQCSDLTDFPKRFL